MKKTTFQANGNVSPSRFVTLDTSGDELVTQATAGAKIIGVAHESTRRTPYSSLDDGYAAIAGEMLAVYGRGAECYLELGGTVARGDRLKSDSSGKGVSTTTNLDEWGAIALHSGVSGDLIRVDVAPMGQISS